MSETKPWRKLWRDVNTDAKFKALARDTQLVFLRLLPELTDDGRFEPEVNADVALKITMLMSLPKRVVSKAIAELTRYGMATIEANGTLFVPAFSTRQQSASSKPSVTKPTSSNAERQRAYRARRNAQRNANDGVTVTESNGVTPVTRNGNVTESNVTGNVTAVTRSDSENVLSSSSASGKIEDFRPQSSEVSHSTSLSSSLGAREEPKRRRAPRPETPLRFTVAELMTALAEGSGNRVVVSPFDGRLAAPITKVIRGLPDSVSLDDIRLVGRCYAAGGLPRTTIDQSWVATTGRLSNAIGVAWQWRKEGCKAPSLPFQPTPINRSPPAPPPSAFNGPSGPVTIEEAKRRIAQQRGAA